MLSLLLSQLLLLSPFLSPSLLLSPPLLLLVGSPVRTGLLGIACWPAAGQRADGAPAKKPTRYGSAGANAGRGLQIEVKCDRRANGAPRDGRTRAETLTFEDHRGQ